MPATTAGVAGLDHGQVGLGDDGRIGRIAVVGQVRIEGRAGNRRRVIDHRAIRHVAPDLDDEGDGVGSALSEGAQVSGEDTTPASVPWLADTKVVPVGCCPSA